MCLWSEPRFRKCSWTLSNLALDMEIAWIAATLESPQEEGTVLPGKILFFSLSQWPSSNQWAFCRFPELQFQTPFLPLSKLLVSVIIFRLIHLCEAKAWGRTTAFLCLFSGYEKTWGTNVKTLSLCDKRWKLSIIIIKFQEKDTSSK
jgi:hypothetical protein